MRSSRYLTTIDVHAAGEVGRMVTSGIPAIPGRTMADKMRYMNEEGAEFRRFLVSEPRASATQSLNLLLPPTRADADLAFLVLQRDQAHAMSGSNAICTVTAALETGLVPMQEPETIVRLDTPAGLVVARAACEGGRCVCVTLDMPECFAHALDVSVEVPSLGTITGDVAYGGVFYFLVDEDQVGLTIAPGNARGLVEAGIAILAEANRTLDIRHPDEPAITGISYVMFRGWSEDRSVMTNATIMWPGRIDRSPCGTGSSARSAVRVARGEAAIGDRLTARSVIGSHFGVEIGAGSKPGRIRPRITGSGWIYGFTQIVLDPTDPFPGGYLLSDAWGPGVTGR
jgi:proline racemase